LKEDEIVMLSIKFIAGLFAIIMTILLLLRHRGFKEGERFYSFMALENLFTPAERSFLGVLDQAVPAGYRVFGKVRLADLIKISSWTKTSDRKFAFSRISRKHVDFVICKTDDLAIAGVIELDDRSHDRPDRRRRDAFIDEAMGSAGIPILHWVTGTRLAKYINLTSMIYL